MDNLFAGISPLPMEKARIAVGYPTSTGSGRLAQISCQHGSFALESVAAFVWNGWQACSGISGRLGVEYAKMTHSANEKAAKLGFEILNDWQAIFRVLEHPHMPLTNNFSERLLRHWVILRRITQGTRSPTGSHMH